MSIRRAVIVMAIGFLCLGDVGCVVHGRQEDSGTYEYGARTRRRLLREIGIVRTYECDGVCIYYPEELSEQARQMAALIARQMSRVRDVTGFTFTYDTINVYMKYVDNQQERPSSFFDDFGAQESCHTYGFPLYVDPSNPSCNSIAAWNWFYPTMSRYMHEITEGSLCDDDNPRLLNDTRRKTFWGVQKDEKHYTRWFRDGFSEYALLLACKETILAGASGQEKFPLGMYQMQVSGTPFSSLAEKRSDLFTWDQFQEADHPAKGRADLGKVSQDYYPAALGLFLLMEDRFGQDAIRSVVLRVNNLKNATGNDLVCLVNQMLGIDIVKMVQEFRFPRTGLTMNEFFPPQSSSPAIKEGLYVTDVVLDSAAWRAGIRKKDAIVSVDGQCTLTNLDFELALYQRMQQPSVQVGVWRKGVGEMVVELPLVK